MKKLLLLLLLLLVSKFSYSNEIFINEQGVKIKYKKPSVSCLYDKEAYEGYLNTCLMLPNYETCAKTKYEKYVCHDIEYSKVVKQK